MIPRETPNPPKLPKQINSKRVPNIILLGVTGVGKSFFGNGLFGLQNPEAGTIILNDPSCRILTRGTIIMFINIA